MNGSGSKLQWEEIGSTQILKPLVVDGFISWRADVCKEFLASDELIRSLGMFRNRMENQFLTDFTYDAARLMLPYCDVLGTKVSHNMNPIQSLLSILPSSTKVPKRSRLRF